MTHTGRSRRPRSGRLETSLLFVPALLAALLLPTAAYAADDASIDHSEFTGDTLKMLVSVPGNADVDLGSVKVSLGGTDAKATAESAASTNTVERTTVLAMDTSNSMRGERITEAKKAALAYLDAVPANVKVGIVSFDSRVRVLQEPSEDRDTSRQIIDNLSLRLDTRLYDGIGQAIKTAGTGEGQHQILLLSDGQDNTGTSIKPALKALRESDVKLDVVSLQKGAKGSEQLRELADATKGSVIDAADPKALSSAFSSEAQALARQVLVTATIPSSVTSTSSNVSVSLDAGGEAHTTSAFLAIREAGAKPAAEPIKAEPVKVTSPWTKLPSWAIYAALGAIFLGVIGVIAMLSSGKEPERLSVAEQIDTYGAGASKGKRRAAKAQPDSLKEHARAAAETVLANNKSWEARVANKLDGAGLAFKPSEWILLHAGIAVLSAVVGFLLGAAISPALTVVLIVGGLIGPPIYLALKRSSRLRAFNDGLADTLQLMSGSLSAGLSLAQSLDTIVREGSEPMTSEFKRVIAETRLGVELEDALDGITTRMDSKDFAWVVMAIRIQRQVGGNLAELLLTVAATLRERAYLRRHVRALSAEGRLSCYILGGLPPVFLLYLVVSKPEYVHPMFSTAIGLIMLGVGVVMLIIGIFWMSKVAKVDV